MNLTVKILIGLVVGIVTGIIFNVFAPELFESVDMYFFSPVGTTFLNLIMMIVIPLVFFSIALGAAGMGDPKKLGRIGGKTISFFLISTAIALVIGLSIGLIVQPGDEGLLGSGDQDYSVNEAPPIMETITNIIPSNPISAMASGEMLQIIAFALFVGVAIGILGEKVATFKKLLEQGNEIMMFLVTVIMKLAPYGAGALIASALGNAGFAAMKSLAMYMLCVVGALLIHTFLTYGLSVSLLGRVNPFKFFKNFVPAIAMAFSLSSSTGTLPLSMKTAQQKLGVSKQVSSFVQPLGATINMDGTAIMQAIATVFIAQVYAQTLTVPDLLTVVLTATLASIGTAGVPGAGMIMLAMVLSSVGLPPEGIALVIGVDRILDMIRTSVNITGDAACAVIVDQSEKRGGHIKDEPSDIQATS
ncbi:dicarboxylate/amino acid:cation symporter [Alkalicoccobacillus gibsonii]|uniref:dicarboxylate/amino acid:cation symporter n=1 Tax=Alkalicoccobacillus gibsonii TaxID=79881 RepID=UPI003F7C3DB4